MEDLIITDEEVRKLLDKASKLTHIDYKDYSISSLISAVDDLLQEYEWLKDEIAVMEQDVEDNYKPISKAEEINFDERDFI